MASHVIPDGAAKLNVRSLRNLVQFRNTAPDRLAEMAGEIADRREAEVGGALVRARQILLVRASGTTSEVASVRTGSDGAWARMMGGDVEFVPWPSIAALHFVDPHFIARHNPGRQS